MNDFEKRILQQNFQFLLDSIDARYIGDYLYQESVITEDELQEFCRPSQVNGSLSKDTTRQLLFTLQKRSNGFKTLIQALDSARVYEHVIQALTGHFKIQHCIPSQENLEIGGDQPDASNVLNKFCLPFSERHTHKLHGPDYGNRLQPSNWPYQQGDSSLNINSEALSSLSLDLREHPDPSLGIEHRDYTQTQPMSSAPVSAHGTSPKSEISLHVGTDSSDFVHSNSDQHSDLAEHGSTQQTGLRSTSTRTSKPVNRVPKNAVRFSVECSDQYGTGVFERQFSIQHPHSKSKGLLASAEKSAETPSESGQRQQHDRFLAAFISRKGTFWDPNGMSHGYDADSEGESDSLSEDGQSYASRFTLVSVQDVIQQNNIQHMPTANSIQSSRSARATKNITLLFDKLSDMVNKGEYHNFFYNKNMLMNMDLNGHTKDLQFVLMYLTASCHLWKNEPELCDDATEQALGLVPYTARPSRCLVEILSSRAWMLFQDQKYNELDTVLDEAFQVIHQDPVECTGKAAGWIYVDKARLNMAMCTKDSDRDRIFRLRREGIKCLEIAMRHFKNDRTKDGPFGYGFAGAMLASNLLMCGDRLHTYDIEPPAADIDRARSLIHDVEDSPVKMEGNLLVHIHLARCDLYMRTLDGQLAKEKALEAAIQAQNLAADLEIPDLLNFAKIRCDFLETHLPKDELLAMVSFVDGPVSNTKKPSKRHRRHTGKTNHQCVHTGIIKSSPRLLIVFVGFAMLALLVWNVLLSLKLYDYI